MNDFPELLYTYRPVRKNLDRESQILLEDRYWFSTPDYFNDPFELRPHFRFPENYQPPIHVFEAFVRDLPELLRKMALEQFRAKFSDQALRLRMEETLRSDLFREMHKTSIGCFAESDSQILMWSYYASSHKGICFGFDFREPWPHCGAVLKPEKVIYQSEYPSIDLLVLDGASHPDSDMRKKGLLTKGREWAAEREWRCLRYNTPSGAQQFSSRSLKSIVLGARIDPSRRDQLLALVKKRHTPIQVLQAQTAHDRFELRLEPVKL